MDKCGICLKPAVQLFETGNDGVYACFKCQPLVPEVTIGDNSNDQDLEQTDSENPKDDQEGVDPLYCGICHKSFQKNMQLQAHLRNHRAERRFVCTYCNKAFSQSNNLRAHLRIHTNERPYKCSECGKAFTQVTNLNNHVRLHTGERPFACPEPGCTKAYAQVTNLNQHRKRHLSGRPVENSYDCPICGAQFSQRNHMYMHRREAHAEDRKEPPRIVSRARRPRACKHCGRALPSERQLRLHMAQEHPESEDGETEATTDSASVEGGLTCVFRSCGARVASPKDHTDHLLRAHQLRVVTARDPRQQTKRGRPPKTKAVVLEEETDPLAIDSKDTEFQAIKIVNADQFQFMHKVRVQSMFSE